jgi:hypothetical protein
MMVLAALPTGASANGEYADEATYTVTIINTTEAQYLTPPNFAAHDEDFRVFRWARPASPGVQAVAENGGVPVLAAELKERVEQSNRGVSGVAGDTPIRPGDFRTFEVTTRESHLSVVSMIICTNDGFGGVNAKQLPTADGQTIEYRLKSFDAGTEINTELRSDLVPAPFCGEGDGSTESNPELAENGVIGSHSTLQGVGDLNPDLDWRGPVGRVQITRNAAAPTYTVNFNNITTGQYVTPPNYAFHDSGAYVWQRGQFASNGVQAVAENGGVSVLAAELAANIDAAGLGISGVGAEGPISPGGSSEVMVTTDAQRFSLVSMVICTNDGFAGLNSVGVPEIIGNSRTYLVRAYDAGTEINTELRSDLVPAPFCGEGEGSGESNPELAENGRIRPHQTLQGVGDLDPSLDWDGPVMEVTITRNS